MGDGAGVEINKYARDLREGNGRRWARDVRKKVQVQNGSLGSWRRMWCDVMLEHYIDANRKAIICAI